MKDHLFPHIIGMTTIKEMFVALVILYQSENINQKILMKNELRATWMSKENIIASYLMKIIGLCNQLAIVGEKIMSENLVPVAFLTLFCWECLCLR